MDRISITQRVLGGLVLLSLVAIFVPWLFDLSQINPAEKSQLGDIPGMPDNVKQIIYRLDKPGVRFEEEDTHPSPVTVKGMVSSSDAEGEAGSAKSSVAPTVIDGATTVWMIQIGTFGKEANALKLRNKLRKEQYPTYLDSYKNSQGDMLWRLKVGPEMSVKRAEELRAKLERDTGLKGLLVQHN